MYATYVQGPEESKSIRSPCGYWSYQENMVSHQCRCWERNSGPPQKQNDLSIAGPFLQAPQTLIFNCLTPIKPLQLEQKNKLQASSLCNHFSICNHSSQDEYARIPQNLVGYLHLNKQNKIQERKQTLKLSFHKSLLHSSAQVATVLGVSPQTQHSSTSAQDLLAAEPQKTQQNAPRCIPLHTDHLTISWYKLSITNNVSHATQNQDRKLTVTNGKERAYSSHIRTSDFFK